MQNLLKNHQPRKGYPEADMVRICQETKKRGRVVHYSSRDTVETDAAIKVGEHWWPKSQIRERTMDADGSLVLTVSDWILDAKGIIEK